MSQSAQSIAAVMLGGRPCDDEKLHAGLYAFLEQVEDMVILAGGELFSRQAIAVAIALWRFQYPDQEPIKHA